MNRWELSVRPRPGRSPILELLGPGGRLWAQAEQHPQEARDGKPIIYVDLDETLIHHSLENIHYRELDSGFVRPHAREFLTWLRGLGDVIILSAGEPDYVEAALRQAGLIDLIDGWAPALEEEWIRGRLGRGLHLDARGRPWVLIDNQPIQHRFSQVKLSLINPRGEGADQYIQIAHFFGDPDHALDHIRPLILAVLHQQQVDSKRLP